MKFRHATLQDLSSILPVYERARTFMCSYGNDSQWINGYPQREILEKDIEEKHLYVGMDAGRIAVIFMFVIGTDPTYLKIENGQWPDDRPYGTIHRLASAGFVPHAGDACIDWCYQMCRKENASLRGDTHIKNLPMQHVFERNGFIKCGTIHLKDGSPRVAYQKN